MAQAGVVNSRGVRATAKLGQGIGSMGANGGSVVQGSVSSRDGFDGAGGDSGHGDGRGR